MARWLAAAMAVPRGCCEVLRQYCCCRVAQVVGVRQWYRYCTVLLHASAYLTRIAQDCGVGCGILGHGLDRVLMGTRGYSTAVAEYWTGYHRVLPPVSRRALQCAAAAARPRAARVVLSCAGAYVSGAAGSNECPAGSTRIANQAACRTAATAAGKLVGSPFVETDPAYPRGCYYSISDNTAYFNRDAVGAGVSDYQVLCAALVTTGAPPPHQCVRVCAPACSAAQCVLTDAHVSHARVRDRVGVAALRQ
jgi:hypothetical protein